MILTFSKEQFVQRILEGTKIHTIREDATDRWKPGMKIHFWKGNPRNVRANPYQFAFGEVERVEGIKIMYPRKNSPFNEPFVQIGGYLLTAEGIKKLAINDGFANKKAFFTWFKEDFKGKIIYFKQDRIVNTHCTKPENDPKFWYGDMFVFEGPKDAAPKFGIIHEVTYSTTKGGGYWSYRSGNWYFVEQEAYRKATKKEYKQCYERG